MILSLPETVSGVINMHISERNGKMMRSHCLTMKADTIPRNSFLLIKFTIPHNQN